MKVIGIIGSNGFIGRHLAEYCLAKGHTVIGFEKRKDKTVNPEIPVYYGDLRDREDIDYFVGLCDGVINLGGILGTSEQMNRAQESVEVNINGALNFFDAVRRHNIPAVQITVGNYTWNNSYAITKHAAERFALMFNKEYNTKIAVVRGLNVYGAWQKHKPIRKVIPSFIRSALLDEPLTVYGGDQLLDLIYIKDTVEILYRALTQNHGCYDKTMEAGSGILYRCDELAQMVIELCESSSKLNIVPMRPGEPHQSITKGDPSTLKPLGEIKFTDLKEGLKETVEWYKNNRNWINA